MTQELEIMPSMTKMTIEERVVDLVNWTLHPAYQLYKEDFERKHGMDPMAAMMIDLHNRIMYLEDTTQEPGDGPIHPRFGMIPGRTTFSPFPDWLIGQQDEVRKLPVHLGLKFKPLMPK